MKKCLQCAEGKVYNDFTKKCETCPTSKPLEKDGVCYACPVGTHYNQESNLCFECATGTNYDEKLDACLLPPVEKPAPSCDYDKIYHEDSGRCLCPTNLPHDTGYRCV